jgi:hypothetical protein
MRADTCRHYNGAINPRSNGVCDAGVNYRDLVGGDIAGWVTRLPCCAMGARGGEKVVCAKHSLPTAEEVAESKRRSDESIRKFMVAYSGKVREWREANKWDRKNPKAASGEVPCEVCGTGKILLSMAAYNGHVWGKCTTDGCVSWVE